MAIFVTGAAGFIGSHLCERLERTNAEVVPLDPTYASQNLAVIELRLVDAGPGDAVVLLGANPEVSAFANEPGADVQANVQPIVDQMHAASAAKLIILASSFGGLFTGPTRVMRPVSPYFAGKLALEGYLQSMRPDATFTIARFANVYGPRGLGQLSEWRGVVPDWMQRRRRAEAFDVWGSLGSTRDFLYVDDLCDALIQIINEPPADPVVHLGTGVLTDLSEVAEVICAQEPDGTTEQGEGARRRVQDFDYEDPRPGYVSEGSAIDMARTQDQLPGWTPRSLEQGIAATWRAFLMEGRA